MSNTTEDVTSDDNDNLPEIYVDEHILKPIVLDCIREDHKIQPIYDKVYEINGTIFREDVWEDEGTLSVFEIHTTNTVNGETEVTIHEATDIHLPICIQETPYGLIINSNVLLTVNQWNTLVDQDDTHKCIVCDTKVDGTIEHIESDTHLRNLEKYQPLQQFDLSITRLIDDMYHCGVCNECFATNADNEHFDSQTHEERMLFATNRVSDVMYDFNLYDQNRNSDNGNTDNGNKNNDCYHFNRNRILSLSDTSGFDSAEGFYDYDFDDNIPCVSEIDNESNDNECSGNDNEGNVIDNIEYNEPNYVSYASIAKKVEATPNYVYVTIFDKKMKMKFDHWHMISTFKSYKTNQLYCMVCKKYWPITQKALHCAEKAHLDKLKCYKFVEEYKNYFIRKIDFKYYHCGLCNNIQLVDEMSQHITAKHKKNAISALHSEVAPKKSKNNDDSAKNTRNTINDVTLPLLKEPQTIRNTDETLLDAGNENNGNLATIANTTNDDQTVTAATNNDNETAVNARNVDNDSPALKYQDNDNEYVINNESPSIYNDVIINQYGFRIRVSFISYNGVVKRQSDYYCVLCCMEACDADIKCHIQDPNHIGRLRCIPFQDSYSIHLIRMVGSLSHCAVCNVAFNSGQTKEHTLTADHIKMLSKGLAINNFQDHQNRDFRINLNQHSIPPFALGVNQHAMHQPAMAMNQTPIPAPIMGMNQWPTLPPTIRMNQPPIFPPRIGTPTINMHQRPMHLPTIGTQPGPSGMVSNQPNTYKNQTKTDMKQHANHPRKHSATNLTTTYINQRTTSMPNLDIDQSNIGMNQPTTIEPNNNKNQDQSDMNQSKKGTNQRATNQFKMEDDLCTVESTMQDMLDSNLNESFEDVDDDLEYFKESFVYLKFKKTFIQVGLASYNSLIIIGDGTAHCFVCSLRVYGSMKGHIDSKAHADNMEQCKFVSKYDRHLLRQMFLNYHCSICNVVFTRKDINKHIVWPLHAQDNKTAKKARQRDLKSGKKPLNINFQNETIYLNEKEPEIKVLLKVEIRANCQSVENLQKKNKIIIHDKNVLKISWDAYHGLCKNKSGHRCVLCQSDVRGYELSAHIGGEYHRELLDKFQTQHLPHLLREVSVLLPGAGTGVCCVRVTSEATSSARTSAASTTGSCSTSSKHNTCRTCSERSGHRCVLCQSDVRGYELSAHIGGEYHRELLDKFQTQHLPHLLREINETTVNCVICNAQVANKEHIIADHVNGKKHKRTYEAILVDSGSADGYADCNHDVLNL